MAINEFVSWIEWWRELKEREALLITIDDWRIRYEFNSYVGIALWNKGLLTFNDGVRSLEFYVDMHTNSVGVPTGFKVESNGKSVRCVEPCAKEAMLDIFKVAITDLARELVDTANFRREHLRHRKLWRAPEPIPRTLHVPRSNGAYTVNLDVIEMLGARECVPYSEMGKFKEDMLAEAAWCAANG